MQASWREELAEMTTGEGVVLLILGLAVEVGGG